MLIVPDGVEQAYLAQRSEPRNAREYADACRFDFEAMKPHLISGDVLDIGCGLGGTTTMIAKHCGGKLHLLDGTDWGDRRINYNQSIDVYNDRSMTEKMMAANGITEYEWWPIGAKTLPTAQNVVSLISWGWHYPVETYLPQVTKALPRGGRLILDLRPGKGGDHALRGSFDHVANYQGFGKCNKTVWEKR